MGKNIVLHLKEKGWSAVVFDKDQKAITAIRSGSVRGVSSIKELVQTLQPPRLIWLMIPAGKPIDDTLQDLLSNLQKGDVLIDGGNSFYEDSIKRAKMLARKGIHFLDVGTSGGMEGARRGACIMIGGEKEIFKRYEGLFSDLAVPHGYVYAGKSGAGHFVKMVHNGIEYGMMQAIAEGFTVLKKSSLQLDLEKIADVYNHGSIIESRLMQWLVDALRVFGEEMTNVSGSVSHTGEGEWTVKTAKRMGVSVPVIKKSFEFRLESKKKPSYTGRVLSALRNQFGGHAIK